MATGPTHHAMFTLGDGDLPFSEFIRRVRGGSWAEIAAELGGTPDARRVRLARGVARITRQLGLDEGAR